MSAGDRAQCVHDTILASELNRPASLVVREYDITKPHDPSSSGYCYHMFQRVSEYHERRSWHELREGGEFVWHNIGPMGCSKKGNTYVANEKSRTGVFIWMCMKHETVVGYHMMKGGEGRRDPLLSLYRFKKDPPKIVYIDCACQAEESGLNWLPEYFRHVTFYHDKMHGYSHKCSERFNSDRDGMDFGFNTPVMEQCNAFLGSIRGLLSSGTTRVSDPLRFL